MNKHERPTLAEAEADERYCGKPVQDLKTFLLTEKLSILFGGYALSNAEIPEYGEDLDIFRLRQADRALPF